MKTHSTRILGRHSLISAVVLSLVAESASAAAEPPRTGEQVYREMCARCHGSNGQGTQKKYKQPLVGEKSLPDLVKYIAKSMPEDDPGACSGEDAAQVASYIYDAFYSKIAQARNQPARVELSRLTVAQYRNAVADVIGAFMKSPGGDESLAKDEHGLKAVYYRSRRIQAADSVIDRIDPVVQFDFGVTAPEPADKFKAYDFSIRWEGSILAPETGEYEFVVRTENGARLWINDPRRPLIDAWAKSGIDTENKGTIFLLGGRSYTLRLEFTKAKIGVDDSDKLKVIPKVKASVALLWKPPHGTSEVIPARQLMPKPARETFVIATPFPPDDRSLGWERGTAISKAWDQATTDAAIEIAAFVVGRLTGDTREGEGRRGRRGTAPPESGLLPPGTIPRDFCVRFAERAFRRPLTDEQKELYIDRQFKSVPDAETAVKRVVLMVLKSPRFLYREPTAAGDAYDVASRLSFGLWDAPQDQELLDAAAAGRLTTREQVAAQAERMLADQRAHAKVREFLRQWLKVDHAPEVAKDAGRFPGFDQAAVADLRTSLDLFLDDVVWGETSDFRQLLLADSLFLNGRLAKLYAADLPADAPFQKVPRDPDKYAGVLSHPYLMTCFAYTTTSSPIHRGLFLARGVLGLSLRPPPEAFTPLAPDLHPDLTTRERVALQTNAQTCQSCHAVINPLGFTLEHFDAVGRYREKENGKPIDASGTYQTKSGALVKFNGVRDLANFLAGSEDAHAAFVEQLFHALVKQPVRAYGPTRLEELRRTFAANGFNVRKLMVEIMAASALPREAAIGSETRK
jgi:cytochrome c553